MEKSEVTIEMVKDYLIKNGIHPSFQRLKIFQHLAKSTEHPTVDMMYNTLSREIPTLSKTTIYNTLNLFQKRGIVVGLTIEDNEVRYDANTEPHAHFKCNECGKVYDIPFDYSSWKDDKVCDHIVKERHFYLKGTCKDCHTSAK
jgi:Fe2+ or Zn2+ uptake regulation protein